MALARAAALSAISAMAAAVVISPTAWAATPMPHTAGITASTDTDGATSTLVSRNSQGELYAMDRSVAIGLSADGSRAAFAVDNGEDGLGIDYSVYVRDFAEGRTWRVSDFADPTWDVYSDMVRFSEDGHWVAFVVADMDGGAVMGNALMVRNVDTGEDFTLVGMQEYGIDTLEIDADASTVIYRGYASPLLTEPRNGVFVWDRTTGETREVRTPDGIPLPSNTYPDAVRADGAEAYLASSSEDLDGPERNGWLMYRLDLTTLDTELVRTPAGDIPAGNTWPDDVSDDGRYLLFTSDSSSWLGDPGGHRAFHAYRLDTDAGEVQRISDNADGDGRGEARSMSADGSIVTFISEFPGYLAEDADGTNDAFARDMSSGQLILLSSSSYGTAALDQAGDVTVSADGRFALITNSESSLTLGVGAEWTALDVLLVAMPGVQSPDLVADAVPEAVDLAWANPDDFSSVTVTRTIGSHPAVTPGDGTEVYQGSATNVTDLVPGDRQYTYAVFTRDADKTLVSRKVVSGRPYAPKPVTLDRTSRDQTVLSGGTCRVKASLTRRDGSAARYEPLQVQRRTSTGDWRTVMAGPTFRDGTFRWDAAIRRATTFRVLHLESPRFERTVSSTQRCTVAG